MFVLPTLEIMKPFPECGAHVVLRGGKTKARTSTGPSTLRFARSANGLLRKAKQSG
jgi:hypothetical protein